MIDLSLFMWKLVRLMYCKIHRYLKLKRAETRKYDKGKCRDENWKLVSKNEAKIQFWSFQAGRMNLQE
ncbi:hypothetical protein Hanom_Chr17g01586161 [Helianthus anomalus]